MVKMCYYIGMAWLEYFYWHYAIAPGAILELSRNYLIGTWHRFLISTHFRTLLSPWHRTRPSDLSKTQNIGDKIMNMVIDFYIRILAAIVRLTIILVGLIAEIVIIAVFTALLVVWLLWPVIFIWSVSYGLKLAV